MLVVAGAANEGMGDGRVVVELFDGLDIAEVVVEVALVDVVSELVVEVELLSGGIVGIPNIVEKDVLVVHSVEEEEVATGIVSMKVRVIGRGRSSTAPSPLRFEEFCRFRR